MTKVTVMEQTNKPVNNSHEIEQGQIYTLRDSNQAFLGLVLDDEASLVNLTGSAIGYIEDLADYRDQLIPSNLVDEITIKY